MENNVNLIRRIQKSKIKLLYVTTRSQCLCPSCPSARAGLLAIFRMLPLKSTTGSGLKTKMTEFRNPHNASEIIEKLVSSYVLA